jgi:DNA-binding NarL/FixJ family response regulator
MKRIRIVLIDPQQLVRESVGLLLRSQPDLRVVGEAGTGADALRLVLEQQPDLVLTELHLPDCTGVELTRRVKRASHALGVIALTTLEDPVALQAMMEAQAVGYVLKRSSSGELLQAIRKAYAGETYSDPILAGRLLADQAANGARVRKSSSSSLSKQERSVLQLVAWGYSSKEIAGRLHLSAKTVETYRARLQRKLNLKDRPALVRYALLQGWLRANAT